MKCPKCGANNIDNYKFCRKCGAPNENNNPIKNNLNLVKNKKTFSRLLSHKKGLLLIGIILIILAISIFSFSSNDFYEGSGIAPGNEKIMNIEEFTDREGSDGVLYGVSFVLTNAPKETTTYYAKATWYDKDGNIVLTESDSLKYNTVYEDDTTDIYLSASTSKNITIDKCLIEITDNKGESIDSVEYKWLNIE